MDEFPAFQDFPNWENEEIQKLTNHVSTIVDNCINNLNEDDLSTIQSRMSLLMEQQSFWVKTENTKRHIYDLKHFLLWLCEFTEKKDNEFFGN